MPIGISQLRAYPARTATMTKSGLIFELVEAMLAIMASRIACNAKSTATVSINAALKRAPACGGEPVHYDPNFHRRM